MLRALILDFDGIIVDSEPVILRLTQEMAAQEGWEVSAEEYYRDYLALDDRGIMERLYDSHGQRISPLRCQELVEQKGRRYHEIIVEGLPAMPGAVAFVRRAARQYPLAIASGKEHVAALSHAISAFGKLIRQTINQANELKDADTADIFTEISRGADKYLWFVEAHAQAPN